VPHLETHHLYEVIASSKNTAFGIRGIHGTGQEMASSSTSKNTASGVMGRQGTRQEMA
jgi:hypothetical protein